jgi:hypothetical protein
MPKTAHEGPGETIWPSGDEIFVAQFFAIGAIFAFGGGHEAFFECLAKNELLAHYARKSEARNPKQTKHAYGNSKIQTGFF